jgi:hypothetical protein
MEIFKNGRKTYVAVSETKNEMIARDIANAYLHASKKDLIVSKGRINGDELTVGVERGNCIVVERRTKR